MQVCAYIGIILCLAVNTHTRSVKETGGETVVEGTIPLHTSFAKAEENPGLHAGTCKENPCQNGGQCEVKGDDIQCNCKYPYSGEFCEQADLCNPNSCKNSGNCSVSNGKVTCKCIDPYTGDNCITDFCTPNPCKNGAQCMKYLKKCKCPAGFSGVYCEVCKCKNGFCKENRAGISECTCPAEWGNHAAFECKECECGKGANCTFHLGAWSTSKVCLCKVGYEDVKGLCKGTCKKNPCLNNGACVVKGNGIHCNCKSPFSGEFCEEKDILPGKQVKRKV